MSGFSAEWLKLREPYDLLARNQDVLNAVFAFLAGKSSVVIVDLACGTGSTLRALAPRIEACQDWRLVDNDLSLLARVPASSPPSIAVTAVPVDLNRDLEAAFDRAADLVTTSALLDLVSEDWLNRFAVEAALRHIPVYAALSYDGRAELSPSDPLDARIVAAVNRHQKTDKGFGPALGPSAAKAAIAAFERVGYATAHGAADWEFAPADREIQTEILSGWAKAAREIGDPSKTEIKDWLKRRHDLIAAGRSSIRVGHVDVFARPNGKR
jgi:hypothetical protein